MPKPNSAPILFGRRMKPGATVDRWELRRGQTMFAVEINGGMWDAEIWIDGDLVLFDIDRTRDKALAKLERMRNRLVKSLTPEGR